MMQVTKLDNHTGTSEVGEVVGGIYKDSQGFDAVDVAWIGRKSRRVASQRLGVTASGRFETKVTQ